MFDGINGMTNNLIAMRVYLTVIIDEHGINIWRTDNFYAIIIIYTFIVLHKCEIYRRLKTTYVSVIQEITVHKYLVYIVY